MAKYLSVKVVRLKGGVVDMGCSGTFEEEEAVMVHKVVTSVESKEDSHVNPLVVVDQLGDSVLAADAIRSVKQ